MQKFKLNRWVAAMLIPAFGMTGCFHADEDSANTAHVSGVVSKGIIIGARVDAYAVVNGIVVDEISLGSDITDPVGKYAININTYSGPLVLVMSPVGDGSSKVKCDVPAGCAVDDIDYSFGNLIPMNYSMSAIIPKISSGANVSASITPFTHMALAYAKEIGLAEAGIKTANAKVAKLLGIEDILSIEPVDVTDDAQLRSNTTSLASIKYGYLAASIAEIANRENGGDIRATIKILADSYAANNGQLLNNEISDDTGNVSLDDITSGASTILEAETDISGGTFGEAYTQITELDEEAENADAGSATDTEVVIDIPPADIKKGKIIVRELRTWATKVEEELTAGSAEFEKKLETVSEVATDDLKDVAAGSALGIYAMAAAYHNEKHSNLDVGSYNLEKLLSEVLSEQELMNLEPIQGVVTVDGRNVKISRAKIGDAELNMSATMPASSGTTFTVTLNRSEVSSGDASMVIAESSAVVKFNESISDFYGLLDDHNDEGESDSVMAEDMADDPLPSFVSLDLNVNITQELPESKLESVMFEGKLSGSVLITQLSDRMDMLDENGNLESITLSGSFSTENGDSFGAKFNVNMKNASTFVPVDYPLSGTYRADLGDYEFSEDGNSFFLKFEDKKTTFSFYEESGKVIRHSIDSWGYESESLIGEYESLDAAIANYYELRNNCTWCMSVRVGNEGYYYIQNPATWSKDGGTLGGTLSYGVERNDENADMWRDLDGALTLFVDYENYPEARVVVSADRTAYDAFTASLSISYDDVRIVAQGGMSNLDNDDRLDHEVLPNIKASIILTTKSGSLEIYPTIGMKGYRGSVKVDGNVIGVIKPSPKDDNLLIVTYINGDIETVNL